MTTEIWKAIKGYEGLYEVSNLGNVRSIRTNITLKKGITRKGYNIVVLCNNGKRTTKTVHRLVATAFVENPLNKTEVNHIDEDKTNNRADNLEWVTHIENSRHGTRGNRIAKANTGNPQTSRQIFQYDLAGVLIGTYASPRVAENETGISRWMITHALYKDENNLAKGYIWKFD